MSRTRKVISWTTVGVVAAAIAWTVAWWGFVRFEAGLGGYANVRLSDHRKEVLFRLGYPPAVAEAEFNTETRRWAQRVFTTDRAVDPRDALPEGKRIDDYNEWEFHVPGTAGDEPGQSSLRVTFSKDTDHVVEVSCVDMLKRPDICPALAGIRAGDSEERVRSVLGSPTHLSFESVNKTIRYDDLGVEFVLTRGYVYGLTLFNAPRHRFATFLHRYVGRAFRR